MHAAQLKLDQSVVELQASGLCKNLLDRDGELISLIKAPGQQLNDILNDPSTRAGNSTIESLLREGGRQYQDNVVDNTQNLDGSTIDKVCLARTSYVVLCLLYAFLQRVVLQLGSEW
jgi:hypothetical protein